MEMCIGRKIGLKEHPRDSLGFAYDGAGNRYLKTVVRSSGDTTLERSDYYVRDAQGNILAVLCAGRQFQGCGAEARAGEQRYMQLIASMADSDWIILVLKA